MNFDDFMLYGKQSTASDEPLPETNITAEHLRKLMREIPKPTVWMTGPIFVIGLPGNVHRFIREMERMSKIAEPELFTPMPMLATVTSPRIILVPTVSFPDTDYIYLNAGGEYVKVYVISLDQFMTRWKKDGEELAELIKRLEGYSR